jgi:hypothetical protein
VQKMGLFDRLMFWKRKEPELGDLGIPQMPQQGIGSMPSDELGLGLQQPQLQPQQPTPSYQPSYQPQMESLHSVQSYSAGKEMEVISAKLDAIRVALDNISQRLTNLERAAYGEQQYQYRRGW